MGQTFNHLSYEQRSKLKELLEQGYRKSEIAHALGVHVGTIYREIKRGLHNGSYDPDYSEQQYQRNLSEKGPEPALLLHPDLAAYLADLILNEHKSPEQIAKQLQADDKYKTILKSKTSIYHAIDQGWIPGVTRESLNSNKTTVFNDGQIHIAKWARNMLDIKDGDVLYLEIENHKLIFTKENTSLS